MRNRWYIYVLAMILALTGYILLSPHTALAYGPDNGTVSVYVYHDVNHDGIWNWGEMAPPNMRGDSGWHWDHPCTHPSTVCDPAEIGLIGARVQLILHGGAIHELSTLHDGPAQFPIPLGGQVVGLRFLGVGDHRHWMVTNVSQKTVNEPANSQFEFHFPLPPTGPGSVHVLLIGVDEWTDGVAPVCDPTPVPAPCDDCGVGPEAYAPAPSAGTCGATAPAPTTYVIQYGDTLWKIAQAFGTTVDALASANGIANPDLIYAGATLTIP